MANRNIFRGVFDAMVDARSRQAAAYIRGPLSMIDESERRRIAEAPAGRAR